MKKDKSALFVKKCLKLFHIKVNSKTEKLLIQIFKFGIVGGIAFIIDYLSLIICKEVFHLNTLLSAAIAFTISASFICQYTSRKSRSLTHLTHYFLFHWFLVSKNSYLWLFFDSILVRIEKVVSNVSNPNGFITSMCPWYG